MIGAAFGLTGGAFAGDNDDPATTVAAASDRALDAALEARADGAQTPSRGLARAPASSTVGAVELRAQPPASRAPTPQAPAPAAAPAPPPGDIPEGCEEYSGNRELGCALLSEFGFGLDQMPALDALWTRESGWNHTAQNPSSGAYGIPQSLPGNKMASVGDDWQTNPVTQIRWGLGYISDRYGSPDAAWAFFQNNGWY